MSHLSLWLAIPLLFAPAVARRDRLGAAAAQLIIAGLGLAALYQGAGSLEPQELRMIASESSYDAWFVGITAGALITGACISIEFSRWRVSLLGAPLALALLWISIAAPRPLMVGASIGLIPAALAALLRRFRSAGAPERPVSGASARWTFAILLPVIAVAVHLVAAHAFPEVTAHWQPLVSTALVAVALVAVARTRWDGLAAALMLIAATRSGVLPFVVAVMCGLAPATRRLNPGARALALGGAVSVGLLVTVLLRDQVLLSVILAVGLAAAAGGTGAVVAPLPARDHL